MVLENIVYVFVPFRVKNADGTNGHDIFSQLLKLSDDSDRLCRIGVENFGADVRKYFLNYVLKKLRKTEESDWRNCVIFSLCERERLAHKKKQKDIADVDWLPILKKQSTNFKFAIGDALRLEPQKSLSSEYHAFDLTLESARIAFFKTQIGIASFGVNVNSSDPFDIAEAEFLLKQSIERFSADSSWQVQFEFNGTRGTFDQLSRQMMEGLGVKDDCLQFSFFSPTPRSNLLSLIAVDEVGGTDSAGDKKSYFERIFYYLRNGYGRGFMYDENDFKSRNIGPENIRWGVSNEVTCCLVSPDLHPEGRGFIANSFSKRFRQEYYFMYIWLLHQKYELYSLLTDVSAQRFKGMKEKARRALLDGYKRNFAEFETEYVFARVTDVPEYQDLYEILQEKFALQKMYDDVRDPLEMLDEVVQIEESRRERTMTWLLSGLALFGVFSAYIDSYDFIGKFFGVDPEGQVAEVRVWQTLCIFVITISVLAGVIWLIREIFKNKEI